MLMAKFSTRRRDPLKEDEVISFAQRLIELAKLYQKWIVVGVIGAGVIAGGTMSFKYWQKSRRDAAAAALVEVRPQLDRPEDADKALASLDKIVTQYGSAPAAREAALYRAHLLYQANNYDKAAKAYKELLNDPDLQNEPGMRSLITESLSYCYEGLGNYAEAAGMLQPLVETTTGPFQGELTRRLAWLYDKAGNHQEANKYWVKLAEKPPTPAMLPYLKEKLADAAPDPKK
jgi:predicted negative regulator of RcsB-dependent stress response